MSFHRYALSYKVQHMTPKRVFVDSDVIISSLISTRGAAYILLNETKGVELYLSNFSILELERVTKRLDINPEKLTELVNTRLTPIKITQSLETVEEQFANYVLDPDDAHIVAGATEAKANFLVSYNLRHFKPEKPKQDFRLILLSPGMFLQYLRSIFWHTLRHNMPQLPQRII